MEFGTGTSVYKYRPLPAVTWFRLLELHPAADLTAPIKCTLFQHPLEGAPPYECLSYTWGDEADVTTLSIDGYIYTVRTNLASALRRLRSSDQQRTLWVDAICIDQQNIPERNCQVTIMGNIYANAEEVLIWLGEIDSDGNPQFEEIIAGAFRFMKVISDMILSGDLPRSSHGYTSRQFSRILDDTFIPHSLIGVLYVFSSTWFARMWVIQEVLLAKKATVYCGSCSLPYGDLRRFYQFILTVFNYLDSGGTDLPQEFLHDMSLLESILSQSIFLDQVTMWSTERSLLQWVVMTRKYAASNPRDKIYALLGILDGINIRPDYSLSIAEVYTQVTLRILQDERNLDVFGLKGGQDKIGIDSELPSWVPNFAAWPQTSLLSTLPPASSKRREYNASGSTSMDLERPDDFRTSGSTLALKGLKIDSIQLLGEAGPERAMGDMNGVCHESALRAVLARWKELVRYNSKSTYTRGGAIENAFWRTVQADIIAEELTGGLTRNSQPSLSHIDLAPKTPAQEDIFIRGWLQTRHMVNRRFFVTETGYMGLAPQASEPGDIVCVLLGGEVPYILRQLEESTFKLIGECYLHGIMEGEAIKDAERGRYVYETFSLR